MKSSLNTLQFILTVLLSPVFLIVFAFLYPLWYGIVMCNWRKFAKEETSLGYHGLVKPKIGVMGMTRSSWHALFLVWIIVAGIAIFYSKRKAESERVMAEESRRYEEQMRLFEEKRVREHQQWLQGLKNAEDTTKGSHTHVTNFHPELFESGSDELEYYDTHFDDYWDDPEDGITYPDDIFDFYND